MKERESNKHEKIKVENRAVVSTAMKRPSQSVHRPSVCLSVCLIFSIHHHPLPSHPLALLSFSSILFLIVPVSTDFGVLSLYVSAPAPVPAPVTPVPDADVAAAPALNAFFSPVITPIKLLPDGSFIPLSLSLTVGARSAAFVPDDDDDDDDAVVGDVVADFEFNAGFLNPNFHAVVLSSPLRLLEEEVTEAEVDNEEE